MKLTPCRHKKTYLVFIVPLLKTKQIAFRGLMCVKEIIQFVDFVTQVRFCNNMTLKHFLDVY